MFGTRDDDGTRAEGGNCDFLAGSNGVSAAVTFTWRGADTDAWWCVRGSRLIPEELRVHALIDCGFVGTPEAIFLDENLVETVATDGLANIVVGIHHADVEFGNAGLCGLVTGPDTSTTMECDELGQSCAGHRLATDARHLEPAVFEDLNVCFLEVRIGLVETQTEHHG